MNITKQERELYEEVWGIPGYGDFSPGQAYLPAFMDMAPGAPIPQNCNVLDAGCGSGHGALALAHEGFNVVCCDITANGLIPEARHFPFIQCALWGPLSDLVDDIDYVYCTDVMEHIPTAFTMLTVQRLLEVAKLGVFFSISLLPDQYGMFVGQPLHQTVQPYSWWAQNLGTLGEMVEMRDLGIVGLYFLRGQA